MHAAPCGNAISRRFTHVRLGGCGDSAAGVCRGPMLGRTLQCPCRGLCTVDGPELVICGAKGAANPCAGAGVAVVQMFAHVGMAGCSDSMAGRCCEPLHGRTAGCLCRGWHTSWASMPLPRYRAICPGISGLAGIQSWAGIHPTSFGFRPVSDQHSGGLQ